MNLVLLWESILLKNFSCGTFMVVRLLETQDQSKAKAGESAFCLAYWPSMAGKQ